MRVARPDETYMKADRLRQRAKQRLHEMEALAVSTHQLNSQNASEIAHTRKEIDAVGSNRLREIVMLAEHHIDAIKAKSGFRRELSYILKLVKSAREDHSRILTLPKWHIDALCRTYNRCFPAWEPCPPHAVISIDASGDIEKTIWRGIYMQEAILYEDMCASYNLAVQSEKYLSQISASKIEIKAYGRAVRGAILAAYYFVEAYLSAMAFDYWWRDAANICEDDIDALLEWNSKKQRQRWLSLEEKTNRYPRIILRVQHCPLAASNCEELECLLGIGKKIRDSIVHASPKIDRDSMSIEKLTYMLGARLAQATEIVNSAIGYVRRLNDLLGKHGTDLNWLLDRDGSGQFPAAAFQ